MASRDYYSILGVNKNATNEEIRSSYKKLALINHPDKNPDKADEFKMINEAYQTLSDPQKRQIYDLNRSMGFNNDDIQFDPAMFAEMFGGLNGMGMGMNGGVGGFPFGDFFFDFSGPADSFGFGLDHIFQEFAKNMGVHKGFGDPGQSNSYTFHTFTTMGGAGPSMGGPRRGPVIVEVDIEGLKNVRDNTNKVLNNIDFDSLFKNISDVKSKIVNKFAGGEDQHNQSPERSENDSISSTDTVKKSKKHSSKKKHKDRVKSESNKSNPKSSKFTKNIIITVQISLEDVYNQKMKKLNVKRKRICRQCNGSGSVSPCRTNHTGESCKICNGSGFKKGDRQTCPKCNGDMYIDDKKEYIIPTIFPEFNIDGEGDECIGYDLPSDICIKVIIKKHPDYAIENDVDIVHTIELTPYEIFTAFKREIKYLDGETLNISEESPIVQKGMIHTIEGKGLPIPSEESTIQNRYKTNDHGDLIIRYIVKMPSERALAAMVEADKIFEKNENFSETFLEKNSEKIPEIICGD